MKITYFVHGHINTSTGGAENAAFSLFRKINTFSGVRSDIITASSRLMHGQLQKIDNSSNEFCIGTSCDGFTLKNIDIHKLYTGLEELFASDPPDIVHIQHFALFGIDIAYLIKKLCPRSKVVLTLHEYLLLCYNNGQMIKPGNSALCYKSSPDDCQKCFPTYSLEDFFLRDHYIKLCVELFDALVSPSFFLADRYISTGFASPGINIIENGLPPLSASVSSSEYQMTFSPGLNRFVFCGQINPYKGVIVLLEAIKSLLLSGFKNFTLDVYGANLEMQHISFQENFSELLLKLVGHVSFHGSYRQSELGDILLNYDWVIVPSIWWENSPVVIQEALHFKRPVIGSDLGGIHEKLVSAGGILFDPSSVSSLASTIKKCSGNSALHFELQSQIKEQFSSYNCASEHLELYKNILGSGR